MPRRIASYLLGAFICIELVFLPLANFIQRIPRHPDPLPDEIPARYQREGRASRVDAVQAVIDSAGIACDRWAEATAQGQGWSLFAPRFGEAGTFLALDVLTSDGARTELRSRFEPSDPSHYIRFDVENYRLFYREVSYAMVYATWTPESFATQGEEWREAIRDYVTTYRRSLSAYVQWRIERERPGSVIQEVHINVRVFLPPKPGETTRPAAITVPFAKWTADGLSPFDPVIADLARGNIR